MPPTEADQLPFERTLRELIQRVPQIEYRCAIQKLPKRGQQIVFGQ